MTEGPCNDPACIVYPRITPVHRRSVQALRMAVDLERVRGAIAWRPSASEPVPGASGATRGLRGGFDLGIAASIMSLAVTPPHAGTLVALELFVLGRLLLVSWVVAGDASTAP